MNIPEAGEKEEWPDVEGAPFTSWTALTTEPLSSKGNTFRQEFQDRFPPQLRKIIIWAPLIFDLQNTKILQLDKRLLAQMNFSRRRGINDKSCASNRTSLSSRTKNLFSTH